MSDVNENKFTVAIKGIKLSEEDSERIKKQIEEAVKMEVKKLNPSNTPELVVPNALITDNPDDPPSSGGGGGGTIVCIGQDFGVRVYWDNPVFAGVPGHWLYYKDQITKDEKDDPELQPNEIEIVLQVNNNITWGKEIQVQYCFKRYTTIHTQDNNRGPVSMRLDLSKVDAIYFRKMRTFGVMHDVYYIYEVREKARKRITFTWKYDSN